MTEYHLPQYYHASSSRENEDLYALEATKVVALLKTYGGSLAHPMTALSTEIN